MRVTETSHIAVGEAQNQRWAERMVIIHRGGIGTTVVGTLRTRIGHVSETIDPFAVAPGMRDASGQLAGVAQPVIELKVELVAVVSASVRSNPVVQVIVRRRSNTQVGQREVLHHFERHWIDQVAGLNGQRIGRARQLGIARTDVGRQIVEGNEGAAHGAASAGAIGAAIRIPNLAGGNGTFTRGIERAAHTRAHFAEVAIAFGLARHTRARRALASRSGALVIEEEESLVLADN